MKEKKMKTKEIVVYGLFVALIAVGAFIQIPIPGMDYFTIQFLFVLLAGFLLGSKGGTITVLAYVLLGLAGVPIFAAGGGITYVLRPSFGFLVGFILTALVVGTLSQKVKKKTMWNYLFIAFAGLVVTYGIGLVYKYMMLNLYVGEKTAFSIVLLECFPLDMPGDIVLCMLASALTMKVKPILKKLQLFETV